MALLARQVGSRKQVLVNLDGAVDVTLGAKQVTQRDVYLDRFLVDLDQVGKNLDRIVGIVGDQVIEAAGVILGKITRVLRIGFLLKRLPAAEQPADQNRCKDDEEKPEVHLYNTCR